MTVTVMAQSTDRDNPTKLTTPEISGFIDGRNAKKLYYYFFVAGPGEVQITLDAQVVGGSTGVVSIRFELFDEDARKIIDGDVSPTGQGQEERQVRRFVASQKARLIMRLSPGVVWGDLESGKFRLRLSGAVELGGSSAPTCLPKQGTLRIKMKDGSIKEIDLKQTDEITIQP